MTNECTALAIVYNSQPDNLRLNLCGVYTKRSVVCFTMDSSIMPSIRISPSISFFLSIQKCQRCCYEKKAIIHRASKFVLWEPFIFIEEILRKILPFIIYTKNTSDYSLL